MSQNCRQLNIEDREERDLFSSNVDENQTLSFLADKVGETISILAKRKRIRHDDGPTKRAPTLLQ
ncbi:hypothetical protein ACHAXS_002499 [Conticribra weissflogii]